jgi:hypothetical protein
MDGHLEGESGAASPNIEVNIWDMKRSSDPI